MHCVGCMNSKPNACMWLCVMPVVSCIMSAYLLGCSALWPAHHCQGKIENDEESATLEGSVTPAVRDFDLIFVLYPFAQ